MKGLTSLLALAALGYGAWLLLKKGTTPKFKVGDLLRLENEVFTVRYILPVGANGVPAYVLGSATQSDFQLDIGFVDSNPQWQKIS